MNFNKLLAIFAMLLVLGSALVVADAPIFVISDLSVDEDGILDETIPALDADGDSITFTAVIDSSDTLTDIADIFTAGTDSFNLYWEPVEADIGEHVITITATDDSTATETSEETITITVEEVNDLPEITSTSDADIISQDEKISTILFIVSDEEDDSDELDITITEDSFDSLSDLTSTFESSYLDDTGGSATLADWVPSNQDVGEHTFTITVTDTDGGEDTIGYVLTVENVNDVPTITEITDQSISVSESEGVDFELQVEFEDIDLYVDASEDLDFTIGSDFSGLTDFDIDSDGLITWTPDADEIVDETITVDVTIEDLAGEVVEDSFTVTLDQNSAPVLTDLIADSSVAEDSTYTATFVVVDDDGDSLTISATETSSTLTFGTTSTFDSSASLTSSQTVDDGFDLEWTPTNDDVGSHTIEITATDGVDTVTTQFTVTVTDVNDAPVISAVDQTFYYAKTNTYTFSVSDAEGDSLTVDASVACTSGCTTTTLDLSSTSDFSDNGDNTYTITWSPLVADEGTHTVTVTASDGTDSTTATFTITVEEELSEEEQDVVDLEDLYDEYEDLFDDLEDDLRDAIEDDDGDDQDDAEDGLDDLEDDVGQLVEDVKDLLDDIEDDNSLDDDLQEDLEDRLQDLEEDAQELLDDVKEVVENGPRDPRADFNDLSGDLGSSTSVTTSGSTSTGTTTSTSNDDESDREVVVTTITPPTGTTGAVSYTGASDLTWDAIRSVSWLIAAVVIAFALVVFLFALMVSGMRRR